MTWLTRLFSKPPRHVAYVPNPAYAVLETYPWSRMPVAVRVVEGEIGPVPVVARVAWPWLGLN